MTSERHTRFNSLNSNLFSSELSQNIRLLIIISITNRCSHTLNSTMPRNCNAKIVFDWLKETSQIQNRKYYTAVQLYQMFKQESNDIFALAGITITQRGFARNLNT